MVAINPMRGKRSLTQMTLNFFVNPHQLELNECDEIINVRRLKVWREKDAKSDQILYACNKYLSSSATLQDRTYGELP